MPERNPTQSEVLVAIARVEEQVKGVNNRLDKLNGTVADIITDVAVVKSAAVKHPFECGYGPKIVKIEERLATGDFHGSLGVEKELNAYHRAEDLRLGSKLTSSKFWGEAKPLIYAAAMTLFFLIVMHFNEIWKIKP